MLSSASEQRRPLALSRLVGGAGCGVVTPMSAVEDWDWSRRVFDRFDLQARDSGESVRFHETVLASRGIAKLSEELPRRSGEAIVVAARHQSRSAVIGAPRCAALSGQPGR